MRNVTVQVYQYDELEPHAQERARAWFANGLEYPWGADNIDTLKAFAELMRLKIMNYSLGGSDNRSQDVSWRFANGEGAHHFLRGARLWRYVQNNAWLLDLEKIMSADYSLTGYFMDETILAPLRGFIVRPGVDETWADVVSACISGFERAYAADVDFYYSDEQIAESIRCNEYEFTESGERF